MANHEKDKNQFTKTPRAQEISIPMDEIKDDLNSLTSNVVGLAKNIKDLGADKARLAGDYIRTGIEEVKASSAEALEKTEDLIKSKPRQSMAIAFAAGLLTSYLLARRK